METRIVSFGRGARWLGEGWQLFRVAPLAWLGLVFCYWLLMTLVSVLPYIGVGAALALVPAFSVGFMAASRSAERAKSVSLAQLFDGFRLRLPAQLALGALYVASLALLLAATWLADEGVLARWLLSGARPAAEELQADAFLLALLVAAALYLPVMMLYWYAPLLVAWHGFAPAKALFFSFFACLMNWRAFLGFGVVTALVTVVLPFLLLGALVLLSGGALRVQAMQLALPLVIVILPTLLAGFYASYRDVFGRAPEAGA